jgi:hydroxypyruvate isomerase
MSPQDGGPALAFDANLKWLFTELPFEQRFDAAAAAGFTAVEYASPYEYEPARLRTLLSDAGLEQILINTPMGPAGTPTRAGIACFPDRVDEYRDGVLRGLEYATALDSRFLHVVAGMRPDGVDRDRAFARYVANIVWAAEQARGTGVRLLLEMQNPIDSPDFVLESQTQAAAVADAAGPDAVGLLFDFYHVQLHGGNLINTAREVWPSIAHLQIADPPARTEPGTGEIGWQAIFDFLRDSHYDGWIGLEYRPATETVPGLAWLKEFTTK